MPIQTRVHAYCLMTNHVHLLLTPDEDTASNRARLLKALAGRATNAKAGSVPFYREDVRFCQDM